MLKKGFSIVELLLVLAILGFVLMATSYFGREIINRNNAKIHGEKLKTAINFARIAAISYGEPVKVCGSISHKKCDGTWQDGQIVITKSGKVLRILSKIPKGDRLNWGGGAAGGRKKNEMGFAATGLFLGKQGSFHYYSGNACDPTIKVIIDMDGRVRVSESG